MTLVNPDLPSARNVLATHRTPLVVIRIKVCHPFCFRMALAKSPPSNFLSFKKVKVSVINEVFVKLYFWSWNPPAQSQARIFSLYYMIPLKSLVFSSVLCYTVFGKRLIFFTHSYIFLFVCYLIPYPSCLLWWKTFLRKWFT